MEKLLAKIQTQQQQIELKEIEIDETKKKLKAEFDKYVSLKKSLDGKKKDILTKASNEAEQLLIGANREIEKTIRHIKTSKAHKEETKKVRKKFESKKKAIIEKKQVLDKKTVTNPTIKIGDRVKIEGHQSTGIVKSINKRDAEVLSGNITLRTKLTLLEKVEGVAIATKHQTRVAREGIDLRSRRANFSVELNIRGMRGEEAMVVLDKYLDDAILIGSTELRVLHGKGDGILRKLVRDKLKKHPNVSRFDDEHADRGGAGITLFTLK